MNEAEFKASVRSAGSVLSELGILEHPRSFQSLEVSERFRAKALGGDAYAVVYRTGLEAGDYNFLLADYSYFQFWHRRQGAGCVVRYAYYPNPYHVTSFSEFVTHYGLEEEDRAGLYEDYAQFLEEQPTMCLTPAVRYELDIQNYRESVHPAAHLHFGAHAENRWAVSRELSPLAFALHICKMFYPVEWEEIGIPDGSTTNTFDERLAEAKRDCRELSNIHFSHRERSLLFFT